MWQQPWISHVRLSSVRSVVKRMILRLRQTLTPTRRRRRNSWSVQVLLPWTVAIGTAHGFYVGTPVLDKERLSEIREVVDIPLVLHGASGLSDEDVRDCVKRGICKVNFATELRAAYSRAVKETFAENENTIDPKAYGKKAIQAVKELVEARMKVCGCDGKAE